MVLAVPGAWPGLIAGVWASKIIQDDAFSIILSVWFLLKAIYVLRVYLLEPWPAAPSSLPLRRRSSKECRLGEPVAFRFSQELGRWISPDEEASGAILAAPPCPPIRTTRIESLTPESSIESTAGPDASASQCRTRGKGLRSRYVDVFSHEPSTATAAAAADLPATSPFAQHLSCALSPLPLPSIGFFLPMAAHLPAASPNISFFLPVAARPVEAVAAPRDDFLMSLEASLALDYMSSQLGKPNSKLKLGRTGPWVAPDVSSPKDKDGAGEGFREGPARHQQLAPRTSPLKPAAAIPASCPVDEGSDATQDMVPEAWMMLPQDLAAAAHGPWQPQVEGTSLYAPQEAGTGVLVALDQAGNLDQHLSLDQDQDLNGSVSATALFSEASWLADMDSAPTAAQYWRSTGSSGGSVEAPSFIATLDVSGATSSPSSAPSGAVPGMPFPMSPMSSIGTSLPCLSHSSLSQSTLNPEDQPAAASDLTSTTPSSMPFSMSPMSSIGTSLLPHLSHSLLSRPSLNPADQTAAAPDLTSTVASSMEPGTILPMSPMSSIGTSPLPRLSFSPLSRPPLNPTDQPTAAADSPNSMEPWLNLPMSPMSSIGTSPLPHQSLSPISRRPLSPADQPDTASDSPDTAPSRSGGRSFPLSPLSSIGNSPLPRLPISPAEGPVERGAWRGGTCRLSYAAAFNPVYVLGGEGTEPAVPPSAQIAPEPVVPIRTSQEQSTEAGAPLEGGVPASGLAAPAAAVGDGAGAELLVAELPPVSSSAPAVGGPPPSTVSSEAIGLTGMVPVRPLWSAPSTAALFPSSGVAEELWQLLANSLSESCGSAEVNAGTLTGSADPAAMAHLAVLEVPRSPEEPASQRTYLNMLYDWGAERLLQQSVSRSRAVATPASSASAASQRCSAGGSGPLPAPQGASPGPDAFGSPLCPSDPKLTCSPAAVPEASSISGKSVTEVVAASSVPAAPAPAPGVPWVPPSPPTPAMASLLGRVLAEELAASMTSTPTSGQRLIMQLLMSGNGASAGMEASLVATPGKGVEGCGTPLTTPVRSTVAEAVASSMQPHQLILQLLAAGWEPEGGAIPEVAMAINRAEDLLVDGAVDLVADPKVDQAADPGLDLAADPGVDLAADPGVDLATDPTVDLTDDPKVDLADESGVDLEAVPLLEPHADMGADQYADPARSPVPQADLATEPNLDVSLDLGLDLKTDDVSLQHTDAPAAAAGSVWGGLPCLVPLMPVAALPLAASPSGRVQQHMLLQEVHSEGQQDVCHADSDIPRLAWSCSPQLPAQGEVRRKRRAKEAGMGPLPAGLAAGAPRRAALGPGLAPTSAAFSPRHASILHNRDEVSAAVPAAAYGLGLAPANAAFAPRHVTVFHSRDELSGISELVGLPVPAAPAPAGEVLVIAHCRPRRHRIVSAATGDECDQALSVAATARAPSGSRAKLTASPGAFPLVSALRAVRVEEPHIIATVLQGSCGSQEAELKSSEVALPAVTTSGVSCGAEGHHEQDAAPIGRPLLVPLVSVTRRDEEVRLQVEQAVSTHSNALASEAHGSPPAAPTYLSPLALPKPVSPLASLYQIGPLDSPASAARDMNDIIEVILALLPDTDSSAAAGGVAGVAGDSFVAAGDIAGASSLAELAAAAEDSAGAALERKCVGHDGSHVVVAAEVSAEAAEAQATGCSDVVLAAEASAEAAEAQAAYNLHPADQAGPGKQGGPLDQQQQTVQEWQQPGLVSSTQVAHELQQQPCHVSLPQLSQGQQQQPVPLSTPKLARVLDFGCEVKTPIRPTSSPLPAPSYSQGPAGYCSPAAKEGSETEPVGNKDLAQPPRQAEACVVPVSASTDGAEASVVKVASVAAAAQPLSMAVPGSAQAAAIECGFGSPNDPADGAPPAAEVSSDLPQQLQPIMLHGPRVSPELISPLNASSQLPAPTCTASPTAWPKRDQPLSATQIPKLAWCAILDSLTPGKRSGMSGSSVWVSGSEGAGKRRTRSRTPDGNVWARDKASKQRPDSDDVCKQSTEGGHSTLPPDSIKYCSLPASPFKSMIAGSQSWLPPVRPATPASAAVPSTALGAVPSSAAIAFEASRVPATAATTSLAAITAAAASLADNASLVGAESHLKGVAAAMGTSARGQGPGSFPALKLPLASAAPKAPTGSSSIRDLAAASLLNSIRTPPSRRSTRAEGVTLSAARRTPGSNASAAAVGSAVSAAKSPSPWDAIIDAYLDCGDSRRRATLN